MILSCRRALMECYVPLIGSHRRFGRAYRS